MPSIKLRGGDKTLLPLLLFPGILEMISQLLLYPSQDSWGATQQQLLKIGCRYNCANCACCKEYYQKQKKRKKGWCWVIHRKTFHRQDISQTGHFKDRTFHRQDISQIEHFIEDNSKTRYFIDKDISQTGQIIERTFHKTEYFSQII